MSRREISYGLVDNYWLNDETSMTLLGTKRVYIYLIKKEETGERRKKKKPKMRRKKEKSKHKNKEENDIFITGRDEEGMKK